MLKREPMKEVQEWEKARRDALLQDVAAAFTDRPADLLPFEEVRRKLHLRNVRSLGLQNVPLDTIVGSVDRYEDFNRAFLPRRKFLEERWERVLSLVSDMSGLPPVELYKAGEIYFVRDGNHRVSVARLHGDPTIEAYVWEYTVRVPLQLDMDVNDILSAGARAEFLDETNLDKLCPDLSIELTQADGYDYLLYEIQTFQRIIARIDERDVPFDEAVALWCDMYYSPIIELIRQRGTLDAFPHRTETDLYLWLRRNHAELDARYGRQVLMEQAADDLAQRFGGRPSLSRQVVKAVERLAEGVRELRGRLVERLVPGERLGKRIDRQLAAALLAPVCQVALDVPECRFQGTTEAEWNAWHADFRQRLWDLLGVGDRPPPGADRAAPQVEVELEEEVDGGIRRELLWIEVDGELLLPAILFVPPQAEAPAPAIVVFPGHGTIDQTAGLKRSYQRANALELARAGFVTLTMELRGFGLLDAVGHLRIDAAAKLVGRTWYGLLVNDALRAIDYLASRPEVDPTRIGATGIGAGGALTMYTAALDDRVQVALVHSYLSKYVVACLDEEHCPCNDIPSIRRYADMGDVAALIAPRPALFVNGQRDPLTSPTARESFGIARRGYAVLGVPNHIRLVVPEDLGHAYDLELAVAWFRRWLLPAGN